MCERLKLSGNAQDLLQALSDLNCVVSLRFIWSWWLRCFFFSLVNLDKLVKIVNAELRLEKMAAGLICKLRLKSYGISVVSRVARALSRSGLNGCRSQTACTSLITSSFFVNSAGSALLLLGGCLGKVYVSLG